MKQYLFVVLIGWVLVANNTQAQEDIIKNEKAEMNKDKTAFRREFATEIAKYKAVNSPQLRKYQDEWAVIVRGNDSKNEKTLKISQLNQKYEASLKPEFEKMNLNFEASQKKIQVQKMNFEGLKKERRKLQLDGLRKYRQEAQTMSKKGLRPVDERGRPENTDSDYRNCLNTTIIATAPFDFDSSNQASKTNGKVVVYASADEISSDEHNYTYVQSSFLTPKKAIGAYISAEVEVSIASVHTATFSASTLGLVPGWASAKAGVFTSLHKQDGSLIMGALAPSGYSRTHIRLLEEECIQGFDDDEINHLTIVDELQIPFIPLNAEENYMLRAGVYAVADTDLVALASANTIGKVKKITIKFVCDL